MKFYKVLICIFLSYTQIIYSKVYGAKQKQSSQNQPSKKSDNESDTSKAFANEEKLLFSDFNIPNPVVKSPYIYMISYDTGQVILQKRSEALIYPSSMTKIMTAYMAFDKLKKGEISVNQPFLVSRNAWKKEGSRMFLKNGSSVTFNDLIRGIIIDSGNDASTTFAEGVCGSEERFAQEMTKKALQIGAVKTSFKNPSGLPNPNHYTTPKDLAIIACRTIKDFPEYYPIYSEKSFTYNGIKQMSRVPLIHKGTYNCDGIKTGNTDKAGFGVVFSFLKNNNRFILVINGLRTSLSRAKEVENLVQWTNTNFETINIIESESSLAKIPVFYGNIKNIDLVVNKKVCSIIPKGTIKDLNVKLKIPTSLEAPIKKGEIVGNITISSKYLKKALVFPVTTGNNIKRGNFWSRLSDSVKILILGFPEDISKQ